MATAAQLAANQCNARHSTGPRTPEGKARSARNALRHGLTAREVVVTEDQREDFESFRASLLEELDPCGAVETITFNELLHAAWNLHRFRLLEAQHGLDPEASAGFLDRLSRYQARAQRAWYRALQELRTLQTNRALRAVKLNHTGRAEVPAIADINELTKQSQSEVTAKAVRLAVDICGLQDSLLAHHAFDTPHPSLRAG